jgi:hypothetical protein
MKREEKKMKTKLLRKKKKREAAVKWRGHGQTWSKTMGATRNCLGVKRRKKRKKRKREGKENVWVC